MRRAKRAKSRRRAFRSQREVLLEVMRSAKKCGWWFTLRELSRLTRYGEASISAQLRHLRKPQYGAFVVEKRCRHEKEAGRLEELGPVWEYQLRRGRRSKTRRSWLSKPLLRGMVRAASQS
jgi:hypothetical protein